jgi:hypothetical protein
VPEKENNLPNQLVSNPLISFQPTMDELNHTSDAVKNSFKKSRRCKLIIQRLSKEQLSLYNQKKENEIVSQKKRGQPKGKNLLSFKNKPNKSNFFYSNRNSNSHWTLHS